jgi:DNA-binding CsgD family transcriptional regulator
MYATGEQVRKAMQLVYECCELGTDFLAWREHLLQGLMPLVDAEIGFGGAVFFRDWTARESTGPSILQVFSDVGWPNQRDREVYLDWIHRGLPADNPMSAKLGGHGGKKFVATRQEVVTDRDWRRAPLIDRMRRDGHVDEAMCSAEQFASGRLLLIAMQRARGRRPFSDRDREILTIVHEEVHGRLERRLMLSPSLGVHALSPRMRQVLLGLLDGDSEKQVALRLGISRHTAHEHVKRLHRHYGVSSRAELLRRFQSFRSTESTIDLR